MDGLIKCGAGGEAVKSWLVLESGLHPTVRERMARTLAGTPHRLEGDSLLVPDTPETRRVIGLLDELLACHERILHYAEPGAAKPYKALERDVIFFTLKRLLEAHADTGSPAFLADLLHGLVWAQGLPNTNHRSTLALVNLLVFPRGEHAPDPEQQRTLAEAFIVASKPLIREKEFAPDPGPLADQHAAAARAYVDALLVL